MSDTSITGTQLRGHDLILALPQYYINFKLKKLLEHGKTSDGKSLQHVSFGTGATPFLTGTVSHLAAKLFIANNPQKILYSISFSEGTCAYWDIMKSPPEGPFRAGIANTTIGFEVDLARAEIAMVDLPADVKADVNKATKTLAPGAFTIQRLFMDFQTAKLDKYDEATTVWPTDFPPMAKATMPTYLKTYLETLEKANGHVLGYDVTVKNPGNKADPTPTFPPTSLKYAVNQYRPKTDMQPADLNPDYDCLNYFMMTGKSHLPDINPWPWMGNFVLPTTGNVAPAYNGTMLVSHKQIMQGWLAPALEKLVTSYWTLADNDNIKPNATVKYGSLTHNNNGTLTFDAPATKATSKQSNNFSNDTSTYSMSVNVSVKQNTGRDNPTITITKTTHWDLDYTHWYGVAGHAANTGSHVYYACTYTATIKFPGVTDGKIKIDVSESSTPAKNPNMTYGEPLGWLIYKVEGQPDGWTGIQSTLDNSMTEAGKVAVPVAVPEGLKKDLQSDLYAFVLPGGSQLFFGDIFFNAEGDMVLGADMKA